MSGDILPLVPFLEKNLMIIYCRHLEAHIPRAVNNLCYGCWLGETKPIYHNLCLQDETFRRFFCFHYALGLINEEEVLKEYNEAMGMATLDWDEIFDEDYRRNRWMNTDDWYKKMINILLGNE